MTLEKSIFATSSAAYDRQVRTSSSTDRGYQTLPPSPSSHKDCLYRNHRSLDRTISGQTFLSSTTGLSNTTSSAEEIRERKSPTSNRFHQLIDLKPRHHSHNPHNYRHEKFVNHSFKGQSTSYEKVNCQKLNGSCVPGESLLRSAVSQQITCSREILLEFPSSMPKSAGRSSHLATPKRSEKSKEVNVESLSTSLLAAKSMTGLSEKSRRDSRPHSADARPSKASCAFFHIFRRKKKSTSPFPDLKSQPDSKSNRKNTPSHPTTPQSVTRSERLNVSAVSDRRPSSQSSVKTHHTPSSSKVPLNPTITSPSSPVSRTRTKSDNSNHHHHHSSRSRSQHRSERRHRSITPASRSQSDDHLQHEDLPPHPSLYKKAVEKSASCPNTAPYSHIPRSKRDSKADSSLNHLKSAGVSSASGQNLKDSTPNLVEQKSVPSTSKTDLKEEEEEQNTSSSSERSRRSRSQSLPSFGGDRYRPDADTKVITDAEDFEYKPTDMKGPLNLSFCGCGFLGMYHLGVVACLSQRGPAFLERVEKFVGASAGALMAAVLVTSRDKIEESAEHVHSLAREIRKKPLGALTPGYSFTRSLRVMLEDILPEDAHDLAQGKLYVSLTNADTKKNELLSDFKSREELVDALVASCYIPVYAGIKFPTIRGKKYMDGGLSDNLPRFETGRTITVSPFDGKSDIGPKQGEEVEKKAHFINVHNQDIQVDIETNVNLSMNNIKKGAQAFFPPKPPILQEYFVKGRYDASRFLVREGLYEVHVQHQAKTVLYESSV